MIPEDATSAAKYMDRIKLIVGGNHYFVMKVLPQCFYRLKNICVLSF